MSQTITFRPTKKLAGWIEHTAIQMGVSQGQFIRAHLEQARACDRTTKKFMRLAGAVRNGSRTLSLRKGFGKSPSSPRDESVSLRRLDRTGKVRAGRAKSEPDRH
jgi:hypothetical protein